MVERNKGWSHQLSRTLALKFRLPSHFVIHVFIVECWYRAHSMLNFRSQVITTTGR
jgi:hypothetical protein